MGPGWFLRLAKWARNPPSPERVKLMLAIVALCLVLYGVERWIGWPDALTMEWTGPRQRISP
ncbi:hypothetical protein ACS3SW_03080 [Roseobacteraceae bacterium S113]